MAYNPTAGMSPEAKAAYHAGFAKGLYEGRDERNERAWHEGWDACQKSFDEFCANEDNEI